MAIVDLQSMLVEVAVYGSAAILLVLVLRPVWRRAFDAGAAYLLWALVPLSMVAALLPAASILPANVVSQMPVMPAVMANLPVQRSGIPMIALAVSGIWAMGTLLSAVLFMWRQRSFVRSLGCLSSMGDGTFVAQASAGLPAVIGILRPRIVLPADYAVRFDAGQQQLVRDHEQVHIARGDQIANLLALALRCLLWFNPMVHWAAARFRQDQELACDARVITRHPGARKAYGEALLRAQIPSLTAPLSCQMGFAHPLKERIAMLGKPASTFTRRATGLAAVLLLATVAGLAANAAQQTQTTADDRARVIFMPDIGSYFPREAQILHLSGKVVVSVEYDESGKVISAELRKSEPSGVFDDAALRFARQVRFQPAIKDGKAIAGRIALPMNFLWQPE